MTSGTAVCRCCSASGCRHAPPRTAMDIAGHSTIEMTMNVYGHVTLDEKREALDKLGTLFEEEK